MPTDKQLLEALKTGDLRNKCDALASLARRKYPSPEITQALLEAANSTEALIRARAMSALRNSDKAGLEIALKNLKDENDEVVTFAGYLLEQIAGKGVANTLKNSWIGGWLGLADERIIPALREALIKSKNDERFFSLGCKLRAFSGGLKVEDLWPFITDPNPKIRAHAAWFLGEAKDPSAREYLLQTLNDTDAWVRHSVVQALHKYMNEEVRIALKNRLKIETDSLVITNLKT
jgi:HEAT repeat protein